MSSIKDLNSDSYWNIRFLENWESFDGPKQSRFFAELAIKSLPQWLIEQIRREHLTLADFGCAQGDGTDLWASRIDAGQISGIDFSSVAIEQASKRYPAIRFVNADWLTDSSDQCETFDVVFSSNTLEHFHKPYEVLDTISRHATKAVILALPYRELDRIDEHFFSFLPDNIPSHLSNGFTLNWSRVVDCRLIPGTMWHGDQIVLVYSNPHWIRGLSLTLSDYEVVQDDPSANVHRLAEQLTSLRCTLDERDMTLRDHDEKIGRLTQELADCNAALELADAYRAEKEIYIAQLLQDIEMRNTGLSGAVWKTSQRLKRVPHYVNRSRQLVATGGVSALFRAVRSKIRHMRGVQHAISNVVGLHSGKPTTLTTSGERQFGPLLGDELVVITGVPFDDIGGGQRGAQLARCALKTGRNVVYVYVYPKYDFEVGSHVESEVHIPGLVHLLIDRVSPSELLEQISERATVIVELPHPKILPFLDACKVRGLRTVFELIDDWETSLGGDWFSMEVYRQFVERSQVVVGTAKVLVQRLIDLGRKDALYLPNASNEYIFDKYKSFERPSDLPKRGRKLALYFGSLYGEWFAWDYIEASAIANPHLDIVLIGENPSKSGLPRNIYFLGAKKIDELPGYLAHADIALLPFMPGKISDAVSPIKIFEYLFLGKPVIATPLPEIVDYPGVYVADSPDDYARLCDKTFDCDALATENDNFISRNSWYSRLDQLTGDETKRPFQSSISAVILIHNNRNIIGRCLESLLLHGKQYLREIIVVDNASTDGGAEFVHDNFPDVRVVVHEINGCASGRNLGARLASGKYLAFFDSDQWFTSSSCFIEALQILSSDASVGVIGWAAGWFDSTRSDLGGMISDHCYNRGMNAEAMIKGYRSDIGYLGTGGFFLPKSVFDATGGFDEFYDPTCFEDTDLSFQIKKLGLKVCFRDLTGIRHQPHQTTKANSQSSSYTKLFRRNAGYFKEKWKTHPEFFLDYPGD